MPNSMVFDALEQAAVILFVDGTRPDPDPANPDADDRHKLPPYLHLLVSDRRDALLARDAAVAQEGGEQAGAAIRGEQTMADLEALLRDGYRHLTGLPRLGPAKVSDADRMSSLVTLGWTRGELGELSPARLQSLAQLAVSLNSSLPATRRYPDYVVAGLAPLLAAVPGATSTGGGGETRSAAELRDEALAELESVNARVRHYYCSASDLRAKNPELARILFQVQREPGEALPTPAAPGTATYDAATKRISVPELPAHATVLRAYRQAPGGEPVRVGFASEPSVSVEQMEPLPAGPLKLWVVGYNSAAGEGPRSNEIAIGGA